MRTSIATPNRRILVVDDNTAMHDDFRKILGSPDGDEAELDEAEARIFGDNRAAAFEVDSAAQGLDALKMVEQAKAEGRPYAVAFVDFRMPPGWNGAETTKRLWQVCPDLQIVICTAFSDNPWDSVLKDLNVKDRLLILKKPFDSIEALQLATTLAEKWRLRWESLSHLADLEEAVATRSLELVASYEAAMNMMEDAVSEREKSGNALENLKAETAERRQAEADALLRGAALNAAANDVVITDDKGIIQWVNPAFIETTGYSAEEAIGQNVRFLKSGRQDAKFYQQLWSTILRGETWRGEIINRKKDQSLFTLESTITPVLNERGEITHFISIMNDVTERLQAVQRMKEQASLLDKARDSITVRGLDHTITFWNKSAERLYGWTAKEAIGSSAATLLKVDPEVFRKAKEQLLKDGEWSGEIHKVAKDGGPRIVEARWTLVRDDDGGPQSIMDIATDVSERKQMENNMLRAQRMESIGTLASGMAHDLNNVLAPILLSVPLLEEALVGNPCASIVHIIQQCAERGAGIVSQMLTFARGVEGKRVLVQVHQLLRDMEKIATETFPRSITIRNMAARDLWPVNADATQLHQVLLNLCVNARDAMPRGGTLTMSASNLNIDENYAAMLPEAKPGPHLVVEISDTGEGIPAAVIERIFDPFFTTKEVGKGTGLGLSTVIGIVRSHGGFLTVNSKVDTGTTFKLFLPAEPDAEALAQATPSEKAPSGNGELILLVEDEASVRVIVEAVLTAQNYRVLMAADGAEALAVYAQNSAEIAIVLTDLAMPVMDGMALVRILRRMRADLPVILSTGHGEKARVTDLNLSAFLNKPYDSQTLLWALHSALTDRVKTIPT